MSPDPSSDEITRLLASVQSGDSAAEARLIELIYPDLHARAERYMRGERPDHTLQPTALVNEAYLRMMRERAGDFLSRAHFLASASIVMRRVLVDHARRRAAGKRPGAKQQVELHDFLAAQFPQLDQMLILDEALTRLAALDARQARIVELIYFGGLTEAEAAAVLGVSPRTIKREWAGARAWLHSELRHPRDGSA